ncbi:Putative amino acid/polyamine transporter I [Colletotrichum destructivum]|uniref:Amino acid/polyamine transporter I n=1 Tax=Colletotrichum destructivum TaxID=34406 RepID=A0AAX4IRG4_9PEZI|nr:Putative amino acid/polyamine transporter I [Colletotrichum destructivum]
MDSNKVKTLEPLDTVDSIPGRVVAADEERLAQLGHQKELKRQFSLTTLGALCLYLMATWEATSTVIAQALLSGSQLRPPIAFDSYNYILHRLYFCIASSLGEIASIYSTAGGTCPYTNPFSKPNELGESNQRFPPGQYHWVAALSPPRSRCLAALTTGWVSVGGLIVFCASAAFAAGLQTQFLIIMNEDSYIPQRWQGLLFYLAILLYAGVMNIWGSQLLPHANMISDQGVIHVAGFVALLIVLGVMAPKNAPSFVFTEFVNSSGWSNDGVSWLVGLISAVYDAACHMAEEIPDAPPNVPFAMVGSLVANGLMGLTYCTVLLFSTGSLESLLTTPTGFPFMQIYLDATRSRAGATVLSLLLIVMATAATVGGITSASVPFDASFSYVNKRQQVPLEAMVFVTTSQMLLEFLYLVSSTAFNAVLSMAIIGIYISYSIPIVYMLLSGRNKLTWNEYEPFKLGSFLGPLLNVISLVWMTVVIIFSPFPSSQPVTAQNMNYYTVVMAGWLLFGLLYYFLKGKAKFEVPIAVSDVVEGAGSN